MCDEELRLLRLDAKKIAQKEWAEAAFVGPNDLAVSLADFAIKWVKAERKACAELLMAAAEVLHKSGEEFRRAGIGECASQDNQAAETMAEAASLILKRNTLQ